MPHQLSIPLVRVSAVCYALPNEDDGALPAVARQALARQALAPIQSVA